MAVAASGLTIRGSEAYLEAGVENRIVLVKACPLRVHVVEEGSDAPVADALVHAITGGMVSAVWGHLLDAPAAEVLRTDATGRATLTTEGGPATLIVRPKEHAPLVTSGLTVPVTGLDVEVRVHRGGALSVSVRGPDGALLAGARTQCEVRPAYRALGTTGADGTFRFGGLYLPPVVPDPDSDVVPTLLVSAPGLETRILTFSLPAVGATQALEVRLRIARMIRGRVRTADVTPVRGMRVRAELSGGIGSNVYGACDPCWAVSDADGGFALGPIAVGLWSVYASRSDGHVLAGVDVTVPEDGEPPPAEVVLPSTDGRLTVRVVDAKGRGVAGAGLEIRATRHRYRAGVAEGVTDPTGVARLDQLAPEMATLVVRPPASAPVARDLTAADFDGRELRIALGDGTLEGRVVGLDQRPRRAHVKLCASIGVCIEEGPSVECDAGGAFAFSGLARGTYRAMVDEADGVLVGGDAMLAVGAPAVTLMVVSPAEAARLHLELRVVDAATGAPAKIPAFTAQAVLVSRADAKELHAPHGPDDSEGRFLSFESLPPGTYEGRLVVPGYLDVDLGKVTLPSEGPPRTIRLDRGGGLRGTVRSTKGEPLEGATVSVGDAEATAGEDGAFLLTGVKPGRHVVSVRAELGMAVEREEEFATGPPREVSIVLQPAGAVRVALDRWGEARRGAVHIGLVPQTGGPAREASCDGDGVFDVNGIPGARFDGLPAGRYRIDVTRDGVAYPSREVDVVVGETAYIASTPPGVAPSGDYGK